MSKNKSSLEKIIEIDKKIGKIKRDTNYRKIKKSIKLLEEFHIANKFITIPSPQNIEKEIRIRRRSRDFDEIKKMYRTELGKYEEEIFTLLEERAALENQIFG
jgi:hypothetical protein